MLILVLVVVTAVCFDFTNGFHDTASAVATSIATGALKPRVAVLMSAMLNLVGAFVSIKVAATIARGIVDTSALWKIVVASLAGGAECAIAFGILLLGLSRGSQTEKGGVRVLNYGLVLVAGLFCVAAVVLGIHAMGSKS